MDIEKSVCWFTRFFNVFSYIRFPKQILWFSFFITFDCDKILTLAVGII